MMISPFRKKDPVETIVILAGGLVIVVFAFFAARGDLEAYTSMITGSWVKERADTGPASRLASGSTGQEVLNVQKSPEVLPPPETPPPSPLQTVQKEPDSITVSQVENQSTPKPTSAPPVSKSPASETRSDQASSVSQKEGYYVQAGAFSQIANAERMRSLLKELGFTASIEKDNNVYKVRIYGFTTFEEAKQTVSKLASQGIEAFAGK